MFSPIGILFDAPPLCGCGIWIDSSLALSLDVSFFKRPAPNGGQSSDLRFNCAATSKEGNINEFGFDTRKLQRLVEKKAHFTKRLCCSWWDRIHGSVVPEALARSGALQRGNYCLNWYASWYHLHSFTLQYTYLFRIAHILSSSPDTLTRNILELLYFLY